MPQHWRTPEFLGGLGLTGDAAALMLTTDAMIAAPITVLIVGIVLLAHSRWLAGRRTISTRWVAPISASCWRGSARLLWRKRLHDAVAITYCNDRDLGLWSDASDIGDAVTEGIDRVAGSIDITRARAGDS